jgi:ATP-dependent Clp protease protease subunit
MENAINILDENGKLKPKSEFLGEMAKLYETYQQDAMSGFAYLDYLTSEENQINIDSTYRTFNFLSRYFYIAEELTTDTANRFHQFVNFWNEVESIDNTPKDELIPLQIYINSEGGDLDAALSIISIMQSSKIPVHTHVYGRAWSGAFFIAICGVKRTAEKYSSFLFHEGNALFGENAHKFIQFSNFYKNTLEQVRQLTTHHTSITEADYQLHKNDDWWLTADDALKYGVIDEITTEIITHNGGFIE